MINQTIVKALSDQVNAEYYSAYLYLCMSAWADSQGFKGVSHWLYVQSKEEMAHGNHIYKHILGRGAAPTFAEIKLPQTTFSNIKEIFEKVLEHERKVTSLINKIADLAQKEGDHATYNFILWYLNEQIEEESDAQDLVDKVNLIGDNKAMLFSLDGQLASRVFNPPFPQE